jgi:hypothetical protein
MGSTVSRVRNPNDLRYAGDPRFLTPYERTFDADDILEIIRFHGTAAVFGRKPESIESGGLEGYQSDGPEGSQSDGPMSDGPEGSQSDKSQVDKPLDPWGRPVQSLFRMKDPFAARDEAKDEFGNRRSTHFRDTPRRRPGDPYRRKMPTGGGPIGQNIAPEHVGGQYNITTLIDESLKNDPFALNKDFDKWREEVEFQFGERPPLAPRNLGPAPKPDQAVYDFHDLAILFKDGAIRPIQIPHPHIRSPLAPQKGTDAELDADYELINTLSPEACASWWIATTLWFLGEDDVSLAIVAGMIEEGSCPAEVFPHDFKLGDPIDYEYELKPLYDHETLRIIEGRPDPIENSFWVPKLKGVKGSAVRFMRPPFPAEGKLDSRYFPIPVSVY